MTTFFRHLAVGVTLLLVFAACSSGDSSDDGAAERARDPEASAETPRSDADDAMHMDEHMDEHGDAHDDGAAAVDPGDEAHTVEVEMTEFAFDPDEITVPVGEPIRFVFRNAGAIDHEAMVGDAHMQEEFAAMDGHGDHGDAGHHGDVAAVTVAPGETAELVVIFDEPGETMLGCHLDGHWEAGMAAIVIVTSA